MRALHVLLEVTGAAAFLLFHYLLLLLYGLGAGLRGVSSSVFWWTLALGYLALTVVFFAGGHLAPRSTVRMRVDLGLLAFLPAFLVTLGLVWLEFPFSYSTGGGHGLSSGGEANAALYPWLHLAFWVTIGQRLIVRTQSPLR